VLSLVQRLYKAPLFIFKTSRSHAEYLFAAILALRNQENVVMINKFSLPLLILGIVALYVREPFPLETKCYETH
jgi:hypothetical protein